MKKIYIVILLILIVFGGIFYNNERNKQLEIDKQNEIEYKLQKEIEQKERISKRIKENKEREEVFLNSLSGYEKNIYYDYYPDYMLTLYINNKVYKRIFTNIYPKNKYLQQQGKCIEYVDIRSKKRNSEEEFCIDDGKKYKIENLDFNNIN